jgi:hypothetical protein
MYQIHFKKLMTLLSLLAKLTYEGTFLWLSPTNWQGICDAPTPHMFGVFLVFTPTGNNMLTYVRLKAKHRICTLHQLAGSLLL